ncbi:hypothetical protein Tco_1462562, partial [Tanacetum coccineum]
MTSTLQCMMLMEKNMRDMKGVKLGQDVSVKPFEDKALRMNGLTGDGWAEFGETAGIEFGQRIVFTNLLNYNISAVLIGGDGLGLTREDILYTMMR